MSKEDRKAWTKRFGDSQVDTGPTAGVHYWPIIPTPAPRQIEADKWDPRPSVVRYRAFCREVQWKKVWAPLPGDVVYFLMPIAKSRQEDRLHLTPHLQVPDADNLLKALLDAAYGNDAHIWTITPVKLWSDQPGIIIERRKPDPAIAEFVAAVLPPRQTAR